MGEKHGKKHSGPADTHTDVSGTSSNSGLSAELRQILARIEGEIRAETRREIHSWLGQRLPNDRYHDSLQRRLVGTCDWILYRPAFTQWLSSEPITNAKLLWINGPPGFGKTILCARIVEHLSSTLQTPVAHYFFSSDLETRDDPFSIIRAWVSQIVYHHEDAFEYVRQRWEADADPVVTRATTLTIFKRLLHIVPDCICVVDGLDECTSSDTGNSSLMAFFRSVTDAMSGTSARVLLVSRDEQRIRYAVTDNALDSLIEHKISPDDVRPDTTVVSREIIDRKLPNKGDDVRSTLSEALANRCDGQFLWLTMQEPALRKGMNTKQLQQAINNSPTGLEHLYDHAWTKITQYREPDKARAFALLRWAAFALRPLTVCEITEAALIDDSEDLPLEDLPDALDADYTETEITVCLVHFTVREYLLPNLPLPTWLRQNQHLHASHEQLQNTSIAKACLHYISSRRTWDGSPLNTTSPVGISLRNYAAISWHQHIDLGLPMVIELSKVIREFFDERNPTWIAWRTMIELEDAKQDNRLVEINPPGPLYYAVRFQLTSEVRFLVKEKGYNVNENSSLGRSALVCACFNGDVKIAAILIANGADATIAVEDRRTPMHAASQNGHINVVRLLLEKGVDTTVTDEDGWTPMHFASQNGHIEVVKLLLKKRADAVVTNNDGWTPMHAASLSGHVDVVKLLVEKGADATATDNNGRTPIHAALQNDHIDVFQMFLQTERINIDWRDKNGRSLLSLAAGNGHETILKTILVIDNLDINSCDTSGRTALSWAASKGKEKAVLLLLANGKMDLYFEDKHGFTPLMRATWRSHIKVVKLLIQAGCGPQDTCKDGLVFQAFNFMLTVDFDEFMTSIGYVRDEDLLGLRGLFQEPITM
ncbi:Putative NACHT nucleoside triphosphatase, P-loop containing nucleoside triphosphate hydrolase [Colletotrichum destructivum]|uniref:NACHT nucleoside triphosphatase, P-loop containing nucleoside triphosphate hydrolase n=1 Tax=Colletotrichum destructivum TaxID=34406 RepID=A0AAX4I143_9PEZI|nr:Putative NACHT nucleoside triphosphatase, P-loop containing nucleoside triphosphate hydrolase [Colletotrichum destructivum]